MGCCSCYFDGCNCGQLPTEKLPVTDVQILEALQTYFANEQNTATLKPDDPLLTSGLLDSLGIVKLLSFIEDEFDTEVDDADFDPENFETLSSITKLISGQLSS